MVRAAVEILRIDVGIDRSTVGRMVAIDAKVPGVHDGICENRRHGFRVRLGVDAAAGMRGGVVRDADRLRCIGGEEQGVRIVFVGVAAFHCNAAPIGCRILVEHTGAVEAR